MPKALASRPTLDARLMRYYSAYCRIARGRQYTMAGPLALCITQVGAYADYFEIHGTSEREQLLDYISALDDAFLGHQKKKQDAETAAAAERAKQKPP